MRIMCVDDEIGVLQTLDMIISNCPLGGDRATSCKVQKFTDPMEALNVLREHKENGEGDHYSVIISDQTMPEMAGTKFLELATELTERTQRIICSAHGNTIDWGNALNRCALSDFLTKPINPKKLCHSLSKAFQTGEQGLKLPPYLLVLSVSGLPSGTTNFNRDPMDTTANPEATFFTSVADITDKVSGHFMKEENGRAICTFHAPIDALFVVLWLGLTLKPEKYPDLRCVLALHKGQTIQDIRNGKPVVVGNGPEVGRRLVVAGSYPDPVNWVVSEEMAQEFQEVDLNHVMKELEKDIYMATESLDEFRGSKERMKQKVADLKKEIKKTSDPAVKKGLNKKRKSYNQELKGIQHSMEVEEVQAVDLKYRLKGWEFIASAGKQTVKCQPLAEMELEGKPIYTIQF